MEEGGDHYERTNKLLESVCEASQPKIFYGSLWECIASNASVRLPAITFLLQHLDRRSPIVPDQLHLFGTDFEVVVNAICNAVQDGSNVLVQRNTLDLLILAFPMHATIAATSSGSAHTSSNHKALPLTDKDRNEMVTAATSVLLRRDMSLNRRLYSWLLGGSSAEQQTSQQQSQQPQLEFIPGHKRTESNVSSGSEYDEATLYFDHFSRSFLVTALKNILARSLVGSSSNISDRTTELLRPYRLLTSLLDKPEVAEILEDILLDVFRALYHAYHALPQAPAKGAKTGEKDHRQVRPLTKTFLLSFS